MIRCLKQIEMIHFLIFFVEGGTRMTGIKEKLSVKMTFFLKALIWKWK